MSAVDSGDNTDMVTHGFSTTTTDITETSGDVIGSIVSGMGNIIGKEVAYSVFESVINLHVESISTQTLQEIKNMISQPLQLETKDFHGVQTLSPRFAITPETFNRIAAVYA